MLDRASACEFAEPSAWLLFDAALGEFLWPEPGTETTLFTFPSTLAEYAAPLDIGQGAFDEKYWITWIQRWSPDGKVLVFDVGTNFLEPGYESRLFFVEFGDGLPSVARPIQNLPSGPPFFPQEWDATSSAFLIEDVGQLYVVHREERGLRATLAASGGVVRYDLCAGGDSVVYVTEQGLLFVAPSDLLQGEGRAHASYDYELSPDGRWIANVTEQGNPGEEQYALELIPCGGEGEGVSMGQWSIPPWLSFSPDSRYLAVETDELGYFDLASPEAPLTAFAPEVTTFHEWLGSGSLALLGTSEGGLVSFSLGDAETRAFPFPDESWRSVGDFVARDLYDEELEPVSFELFDARAPEEALLAVDLGSSELGGLEIDRSGSRFAYVLSDLTSSHVSIVDLRNSNNVTYFDLPGDLEVELGAFSADGRGILASTRFPDFKLYWLSAHLPGGPAEPRLIHSASAGDLLEPQPWP